MRFLIGDDISLHIAEGRIWLVLDAVVESLDDVLLEMRRAGMAVLQSDRSPGDGNAPTISANTSANVLTSAGAPLITAAATMRASTTSRQPMPITEGRSAILRKRKQIKRQTIMEDACATAK